MKRALAVALGGWLALAAPVAAADLDRAALTKHIRKSFSLPPDVELEIKDLHASPIAGFLQGTIESRYKGRSQSQILNVTQDGRYYVLSAAYELGPSNVPGLLGRTETDAGAPAVYVSKDFKRFLLGDVHDLKVDPDAANLSKIRLSGVAARGPADAPVVLVEYSDLECPYCRSAHLELDQKLAAAYGKKVRWVFKHFPLTSIHPWSYNAAIAAACATRQKPEAGWSLESDFFENQGGINPSNVKDKALEAAKKAGLDAGKFAACYDRQEAKLSVDADMREGDGLGVNSTPTFFVNGRKLAGFSSFDSFKALIDEALAEKSAGK